MPTVLLFTWFYLPFIGGSELFVRAITQRLSHRYRFVIVTARGQRSLPRWHDYPEAKVLRVGMGTGIDKFFYPASALRAALSIQQVDLVHAVMVNAAALSAWSYLKIRPRPSLLTLQSGDSERYVKQYMGPAFPVYRFLHRPFDKIHAISSHLRDRAIRFGASPESITLVPNGVDLDRFDRQRFDESELRRLRSQLGVEGKRVIVSVSRLALKNGLDTLVRALPLITAKDPGVALVLVGDGEDREKLDVLAREVGVRDRLVFAGPVAPNDIARYLAMADVFSRPSISEGLGTAFLEAMACRLPVVASAVGGISDFLEDGNNGLVCEVGSEQSVARAISRILKDPALARRLADAGRKLVASDYHWERVADQIGELYDGLLAQ